MKQIYKINLFKTEYSIYKYKNSSVFIKLKMIDGEIYCIYSYKIKIAGTNIKINDTKIITEDINLTTIINSLITITDKLNKNTIYNY